MWYIVYMSTTKCSVLALTRRHRTATFTSMNETLIGLSYNTLPVFPGQFAHVMPILQRCCQMPDGPHSLELRFEGGTLRRPTVSDVADRRKLKEVFKSYLIENDLVGYSGRARLHMVGTVPSGSLDLI